MGKERGASPSPHYYYSTILGDCKHFFEIFTPFFVSYVQSVNSTRLFYLIMSNHLTELLLYDKIILVGCIFHPAFFVYFAQKCMQRKRENKSAVKLYKKPKCSLIFI